MSLHCSIIAVRCKNQNIVFNILPGAVGVLVGFDTLCLQNRWGGHGPIPLSIAQPSLQHRQSTIEMKQNPMGEGGARSDNVVFDLHGEMKPTSWM